MSDSECGNDNDNELGYLHLLENILENGEWRETRNSKTISLFSVKLDFDISRNFPLLTTKKMYWKGICEELLWFLRGDTNSKNLEDKNVTIWKGNSTREFLNKTGLTEYKEGECGPIYGFQWRHFNAKYKGCNADYEGEGIDQLQECIDLIKNDPTSRRIYMSGWNPCQLKEMCLPPCHVSYQFYVNKDNELSCMMYQRSADVFLGLPFNIASTGLLTYIMANFTGKTPSKISIVIGDAHIYEEHIDAVKKQLKRIPYSLPKMNIKERERTKIEDYTYEDFEILDYKYHPIIKAKMVA